MGDIYTNPPQSRNEAILRATIDGTEYTAPPQSRIEDLLIELKAAIEQSGGGTTVVANPEAAATDEVKKLQVGSTVYAVEDEAGRQLVKDTVGWTSENLYKGITAEFTDNYYLYSDGSTKDNTSWMITDYYAVNGNDTYILKGYGGGSTPAICFYDSSKNYISGIAYSGKPSLNIETPSNAVYCRFSINKNTAENTELYHASVEEYIPQVVSDAIGWDVENQLEFPYYASSVSGDIPITSKEDGSITIGSGTATQREVFYIKNAADDFHPPKGRYKLSKGFQNNKIGINIDATNGNTWVKGLTNSFASDDNEFDIDYDGYDRISIYLACEVGAVSTGITFTPKLTHITVDEQKADNTVIAPVENGTTVQNPSGYAVGSHAIRNGAFITWKNAKAQGETINDASDYDSGDVGSELTTKSIAVTPVSGVTFDTSVTACKRYGNVCILNIKIDNRTQAADTNAKIGSIASDFPAFSVSNIVLTNGADTIGYLSVTSDGGIWLRSLIGFSNVTLYGEIMWIL